MDGWMDGCIKSNWQSTLRSKGQRSRSLGERGGPRIVSSIGTSDHIYAFRIKQSHRHHHHHLLITEGPDGH